MTNSMCLCRGCNLLREQEQNRIIDILKNNGVQYNSKVIEEIKGLK